MKKPESLRVTTVRRYIQDIEGLLGFPKISPDISRAKLKNLPLKQAYRLTGPPSPQLIKNLIQWGLEKREAGLWSFRGHWILILSDRMAVETPPSLIPLLGAGLSSFDLHTHPSGRPISSLPSFEDMRHPEKTLNKVMHIASPQGLSVVHFFDHHRPILSAFINWAQEQGYPTDADSFRKSDWQAAFAIFLKQYHGYEVIPWSNETRIQQELNKGQYDPLMDPSFVHNPPADWHSRVPVEVGPFTIYP